MVKFDIAIIGSGPGGYVAAIRAAQYGANVAIIEKADLGGTCLNWGCIPSKALLESVHVLKMLKNAEQFGLSCDNISFDLEGIYERKDGIVEKLRDGISMLMKKNKVTVITGHGRLKDINTVLIEGEDLRKISADKIILATGTRPFRPDFLPMDEDNVVDSDYFLALSELPKSVLVIGGGYIGCEMATVLNGLGCEVTIVEMQPQLLPTADGDISKEMRKHFKKAKMGLYLDTKVEKIEIVAPGEEIKVNLSNGKNISVEKVLVSIGREMCTENLGLENAGIKVAERGIIKVNEFCQTNIPNIYAIGDITGNAQLAHVASHMGLTAATHATGKDVKVDLSVIPACVFTQPEVGNVGLTEEQAVATGANIKTAKFPYAALGKAMAMGERDGFFKVIAEAKSGKVLGVHIVGVHASDLIGEATIAMKTGCTVKEIAHTIHAHPTLHEGMMECTESWMGMGIHS